MEKVDETKEIMALLGYDIESDDKPCCFAAVASGEWAGGFDCGACGTPGDGIDK